MANGTNLTEEIQALARKVTDVMDAISAMDTKWVAVDGGTLLDDHFLDSEGNPRTDLGGLTKGDIVNVVTSARTLRTMFVDGHKTNFYKAQ